MSSRREVLIRRALQRKTLIETKNRTLLCLNWHYSNVTCFRLHVRRKKKTRGVGIEVRAFPPLSLSLFSSPFFFSLSSFALHSNIQTPGTGYEKCYSVDGGQGICHLFSSPPRGIWKLKSPQPREFAIQGKKKNAKARGSAGAGGGGLGAAGKTDWCIKAGFH